MLIKIKIVSCNTADSKPVKQEVNSTVILPPSLFSIPQMHGHSYRAPRRMSTFMLILTLISARAKTHTKFNVHHRYRALRAKRMLTDSRVHAHSHERACNHIHSSAVFAHVHCWALWLGSYAQYSGMRGAQFVRALSI